MKLYSSARHSHPGCFLLTGDKPRYGMGNQEMLILVLVGLVACNVAYWLFFATKEDTSGRIKISGIVTNNGELLPEARLNLKPVEGGAGPTSAGWIIEGEFHVPASDGPHVGEQVIEILIENGVVEPVTPEKLGLDPDNLSPEDVKKIELAMAKAQMSSSSSSLYVTTLEITLENASSIQLELNDMEKKF